MITYDHEDRILRLKNGKNRQNLFKPDVDDKITTVESIDNYNIAIGFESGLVRIVFNLFSHWLAIEWKPYSENELLSHLRIAWTDILTRKSGLIENRTRF